MTKLKIKDKRLKRGYILISVMVIMMVMLVITYFLADALFSEMAIANNQKAATLSFHLAEAGTQEAVWRVQNDTATRNTFLNTTAGVTTFSHNGALLNGGSYTVTIQNTAKGAATITATGLYTFGLKQAQRVITLNVYQTTSPAPYTLDGVLMVGGPNPGDINLTNTTISQDSGYDPSSIIGGGNIFATNATINLTKDYLSDKQISFTNANLTAAGNVLSNQNLSSKNSNVKGATVQGNYNPPLPAYNLPMVDVTSSCATNLNSYKCLAQSQGQYYNSSQTYKNQSNLTFNGITYVAGSVTFTNVSNLTINGILVAEGSISFTNVSNLTVNHTTGPSGLITLQNLNTTNFTGVVNGLVYVGVQAGVAVNTNLTINGALLAHSFSATNATLKLNFNKDWVNEALQPGATNSPVIQFQHWEEEY